MARLLGEIKLKFKLAAGSAALERSFSPKAFLLFRES